MPLADLVALARKVAAHPRNPPAAARRVLEDIAGELTGRAILAEGSPRPPERQFLAILAARREVLALLGWTAADAEFY